MFHKETEPIYNVCLNWSLKLQEVGFFFFLKFSDFFFLEGEDMLQANDPHFSPFFFFFFLNKFIYLFIFGCVGSSLLCTGFL